jgi:MFS family permease
MDAVAAPPGHPVTRWLTRASPGLFATYAVAMAFTTYFAMYSFRKPFAAAHFEGASFWILDLKSALVISQLAGYALSKFLGIKFNSEMPAGRRAWSLIWLILFAEAALVAFAVLPPGGKVIALFLNGLPLGTVWGIVFSFLEGRRTSEILGAGLSCAYVVASGFVKSVGAILIAVVGESWMPAATGALFLPIFFVAVYGLALVPPPSEADVAARTEREPMSKEERRSFVRSYWPGLVMLVLVYLCLTGYRDFRDNFAAEIWADLGNDKQASVFALTEIPIALSVMLVLGLLYLVRNNRRGLALTYVIMWAGAAMIGAGTILFDLGVLPPMAWMIAVGLGLYLGYVPYGCVLFDRTIAALQIVATAVFLIYVSDAVAYGGSVGIVLYKNLGQASISKLQFFRYFSYVTCVVCVVCLATSARYFLRRAEPR